MKKNYFKAWLIVLPKTVVDIFCFTLVTIGCGIMLNAGIPFSAVCILMAMCWYGGNHFSYMMGSPEYDDAEKSFEKLWGTQK